MRRITNLVSLFFVLSTATIYAGQISQSAFTSAATVQTFQSLGESVFGYTTPMQIGNDTYDGDGHRLYSSDKISFSMGRSSGIALGNDPPRAHSQTAFIDIQLGNPALRAGMYVGFEVAWTATAEFYNTNNLLLGTIPLSGNARDSRFAAWQADSGMIGRIRVVDAISNNTYRLCIDDVIQEVPEPASGFMAGLGFLARLCFWRRLRISK